jgi:hypothetical protein
VSTPQIAIHRQALLARVNRYLRKQGRGERLFRARGERASKQVGNWFLVNSKAVTGERLELEPVARKLGVLRPWERLDEEVQLLP